MIDSEDDDIHHQLVDLTQQTSYIEVIAEIICSNNYSLQTILTWLTVYKIDIHIIE